MRKKNQGLEEFKLLDKSLYFSEEKIFAVGDFHLGYEEFLNEQGIFLPHLQFKEIMNDLKKIFKEIGRVKKIIILGDLKHEFGTISSQEWREVKRVLDFLREKSEEIILIKGNHDTILEPIAKRKEIRIEDFYVDKDVCFLHGHKLFPECLNKKIKTLVLGHRHPAVVLEDKYKKEKYKCFLVGKWKGKRVFVLPSFFPFVEGGTLTNYEENKLFISEKSLKNFDVYVVGDVVYKFGKLKRII